MFLPTERGGIGREAGSEGLATQRFGAGEDVDEVGRFVPAPSRPWALVGRVGFKQESVARHPHQGRHGFAGLGTADGAGEREVETQFDVV